MLQDPSAAVCAYGGGGGGTIGDVNQTQLFFGGGGAQGGADEDGFGSAGAAGGGILICAVTGITMQASGTISSHGSIGAYQINEGGCGSGGGGAGAGGSVFLRVDTATLRCNARAEGGVGGSNYPANCGVSGGAGGLGRATVQQLQGTSAFPVLVNQPFSSDGSNCSGDQFFAGKTFRPVEDPTISFL